MMCNIYQESTKQKIVDTELIYYYYKRNNIQINKFEDEAKKKYLETKKKKPYLPYFKNKENFIEIDKDLEKHDVFQLLLTDNLLLISNVFAISKDGSTIVLYNQNHDTEQLENTKKENECQMLCNMAVCRADKAIMLFKKSDTTLQLNFCIKRWEHCLKDLTQWSHHL
jgi:hypothetical protein